MRSVSRLTRTMRPSLSVMTTAWGECSTSASISRWVSPLAICRSTTPHNQTAGRADAQPRNSLLYGCPPEVSRRAREKAVNHGCRRGIPPMLGRAGPVPDRLQNLHVAAVRPFVIEAGDLQQEGNVPERRVGEYVLEAVQPDVPLADVLVAVYAAGQRALGVVGVDGDQPVEPHALLELRHRRPKPVLRLQVVAGGEGVLRVQAHLHPRAARLADDPAQLIEPGADGAAHAGAVLQDEPGVRRRRLHDSGDGLHDLPEDLLVADAAVAADVEDDAQTAEQMADVHVVHQGVDALRQVLRVVRGQVHQVDAVDVRGPDAGLRRARPVRLYLLRAVLLPPPGLGRPAEYLDRLRADLLGAIDRLLDASGGPHVRSDLHGATILPQQPLRLAS